MICRIISIQIAGLPRSQITARELQIKALCKSKFAEFVINPIRKAFGFDWINIFGAYADEIDFEDVLSEGEKVECVETANGSWASVYRYRGLYFYCDEVQNLGPFSQYSDIQEKLEQLYEHVQNDKFNTISYHLKK